MNKPTQADLLGYLLGALDPEEMRQTEQALAQDEDLRIELEALEEQLCLLGTPVEGTPADNQRPPTALARRTCELIATLPRPGEIEAAREKVAGASRQMDERGRCATKPGWSAVDVFVTCCVCILVALIFLPAIAHSRFQSDILTCQNNLRVIGASLENYADSFGGRLIPIPTSEPYGVAGFYAAQLRDNGLVDDDNLFFCPSSKPVDGLVRRIPRRDEIVSAKGMDLRYMLQQVGGDYAYTLGCMNNGEYCQPRLSDDYSLQVLLADSPNFESPGLRSGNHLGRGQNVLLGDFSTKYILTCMVAPGDNFYQNDNGVVAAGMSVNDSVLGASATPPFRF